MRALREVVVMERTLDSHVTITWAAGLRNGRYAHEATILGSGWLRVTWLDGTVTHVSPASVYEITGKGVSYGD